MNNQKEFFILLFVSVLFMIVASNNIYACSGSSLAGNLTPDVNWQTVPGVQAGDRYTFTIGASEVIIFTFCQGGASYTDDPMINIHNDVGTIVYEVNDDHCGLGSEIVWVCPSSGTYSIGLYEYNCQNSGIALGTIAYKLLPTPTEQDCLGALPLCNTFNNHTFAALGEGNYYDLYDFRQAGNYGSGWADTYDNCPNCMLDGELNSMWYSFTAQSDGWLKFTITHPSSEIYDWSLHSLNGGVTCFDLVDYQTYPPVSCNWWGDIGTGTSTGMEDSGTTDCQYWPGSGSGNAYNNPIWVTAGETFALHISSYVGGPGGYSIDFGNSTAQILDNSPPVMDNLLYAPYCGSSSLTVQFSEAVWCSSVQPVDFELTGPSGTYSIDDTWSVVCASASANTYAGTWYDDVWTLELGDYLSQSGDYILTLNAGSVEDKCTNTNGLDQLLFTVVGISADVNINANAGCSGSCDGEIQISNLTGGTAPYFIDWSGPSGFTSTNQTISNLCPGTYTLTITDSEGVCEYVETINLNNTPPINAIASSNTPVCQGETLDLTGMSDDPASTYSWSGPGVYTSIEQNPSRINADIGMTGTYSLVVTDSNGCTESTSTDVVVYPVTPVVISDDSPYCEGEDIQLNATTVIGATYSWVGPGMFNSTDEDPLIAGCDVTDGGAYILTVTDVNMCEVIASANIVVNPGITANVVAIDPLCYQEATGEITILPLTGTPSYDYIWPSGSTSNPSTGLVGGQEFCVTVTDAASCSLVICHTLTDPPDLVADIVTVPTECGYLDGQIITNASGGAGGYVIDVTEGYSGSPITGLHPGDYTVTVTDANLCEEIQTVTVGFFGAGVVEITQVEDIMCFGNQTAVLHSDMSNGTPPYNYEWSEIGEAGSDITGIGVGLYSVTITDTYGCYGVDSYDVLQPEVVTMSIEHEDVLCRGEANGSATVSVVGGIDPYVYSWEHGPLSSHISSLTAGTYSVVVEDVNGCSLSDYVVINQPEKKLSVSIVTTDVSCTGRYDGIALGSGDGGTLPYTIQWYQFDQFIGTGEQLVSLSAGEYYIKIYDDNSCFADSYFTIYEPTPLIVETDVAGVTCKGYNDGYINVIADGGTMPYQYQWSNGDSLSLSHSLLAGQYFITVSDMNECQKAVGLVVEESSKLCLGIPDAFTPNGDGINDTWEIEYIEMYSGAYVNVFSRWGQHIYQGASDSEFWDGTFNGHFVPAGSYQYVVDLRNGMEPFTGVVVVVY